MMRTSNPVSKLMPSTNGRLTCRVVTMSPSHAAKLVQRLHPNERPTQDYRIEALANDMKEGRWFGPEHSFGAIVLDPEGRVVDGQKRLMALSRCDSDTRIKFWVMHGVNAPKGMRLPVGDIGQSRRANDIYGGSAHDWAVARALLTVANAGGRAVRHSVSKEVVSVFKRPLLVLCGPHNNVNTSSARAAFVLYWMMAPTNKQQEVESLYQAYISGDLPNCTPALQTLFRSVAAYGNRRQELYRDFPRTYKAITCPDLTMVKVTDVDKYLALARTTIKELIAKKVSITNEVAS
jgi:hypothetical protein